jgi:intracellular septation protein A
LPDFKKAMKQADKEWESLNALWRIICVLLLKINGNSISNLYYKIWVKYKH